MTIVDSVGNALADGDTVTITKTLKVKGAQQPLKAGTKVCGIRPTAASSPACRTQQLR
ncbi:PhnA domain-containing protein [Corynebacterium aurimucosum]|nr:PhnA domain-containing protein [Corynebacterium aurimucosum]UTA72777.1 PhnA domain-containing protein [Corynebacterium aurimucosum]